MVLPLLGAGPGSGVGGGGGGGGTNTWDPAAHGADIVLSGGNLTATKNTTATAETVFGTRGLTAGASPSFTVYYSSSTANPTYTGISTADVTKYCVLDRDGVIYHTTGSVSSGITWGVGDTITCLPNFTAKTMQFQKNGGTAFPTTPVDLTNTMTGVTFYPYAELDAIGTVAVLDPTLWA